MYLSTLRSITGPNVPTFWFDPNRICMIWNLPAHISRQKSWSVSSLTILFFYFWTKYTKLKTACIMTVIENIVVHL